jgi:hypothetical protein
MSSIGKGGELAGCAVPHNPMDALVYASGQNSYNTAPPPIE